MVLYLTHSFLRESDMAMGTAMAKVTIDTKEYTERIRIKIIVNLQVIS